MKGAFRAVTARASALVPFADVIGRYAGESATYDVTLDSRWK